MKRIALLCVLLAACSNGFPVRFGTPRGQHSPTVGVSNPYLFQGNSADGRRAFIELQCVDCHRVEEDPTLPVGKKRAVPISVLVNMKKYSENDLVNIIRSTKTGAGQVLDHKTMKDYTEPMTDRQLVDIVAYLRNPGKGQ